MSPCSPLSLIAALASGGSAVGLHIRAVAFERRGGARDVYTDEVERSIFRQHVDAETSERDRCKLVAERYKVAGYLLVLAAAFFAAAPVVEGWCISLLVIGVLTLAAPGTVLYRIGPLLKLSFRQEWDLVHYNKWTQEVIPPWPGFQDFFRQRKRGIDAQLEVTTARTLLIVSLREVYDFVMKRGKGQGTGGATGYDFVGWRDSLQRLGSSIERAIAQADLSPGQSILVAHAASTALTATEVAATLANQPAGKRGKWDDYTAVWRQQWLTLDAIAKARQAVGDECPRAELDEIQRHISENGATSVDGPDGQE